MPAETTARFRVGELEALRARDALEQRARLRADLLAVAQMAGIVVGELRGSCERRLPLRGACAATNSLKSTTRALKRSARSFHFASSASRWP
jgi:hypothetical protein